MGIVSFLIPTVVIHGSSCGIRCCVNKVNEGFSDSSKRRVVQNSHCFAVAKDIGQ